MKHGQKYYEALAGKVWEEGATLPMPQQYELPLLPSSTSLLHHRCYLERPSLICEFRYNVIDTNFMYMTRVSIVIK